MQVTVAYGLQSWGVLGSEYSMRSFLTIILSASMACLALTMLMS